jgi:hypothetical protein
LIELGQDRPASNLLEHEVPLKAIAAVYAIVLALAYLALNNWIVFLETWVLSFLVYLGLLGFYYVYVEYDSGLNPWILKTEMDWFSILTTRHYLTWLYNQDRKLWFNATTLIMLPLSTAVAALLFNVYAALVLVLIVIIVDSSAVIILHRFH